MSEPVSRRLGDPVGDQVPLRQLRAVYTDRTVTVYQAYPPAIANAAMDAGTFVAPFKRERMTWIKPSFLWMAYRSGWATKPGQERVLAIDISRAGFEWALEHACLSHFESRTYRNEDEWSVQLAHAPVRIQWDPERDLRHQPLQHRSIQIGLGGPAVDAYVDEWIMSIEDATERFRTVGEAVSAGRDAAAAALLPAEVPYPLSEATAAVIGASRDS